jgi:hypothetical protein
MRAPIVILALVATPFIANIAAAQGKSSAAKDACAKPGNRTGQERKEWIQKHSDKSCQPVPTPTPGATGTSITGTVFIDLDWSEVPNPGEPLLPDWTVQLLANGAVVMTATTDANGVYKFANVSEGNYTVCVTPKTNFSQIGPSFGVSCPSGTGYSVSATMYNANVAYEGLDFGYYAQ